MLKVSYCDQYFSVVRPSVCLSASLEYCKMVNHSLVNSDSDKNDIRDMRWDFLGGGGWDVDMGIRRCKFCGLLIQLLNPFALRTAKNP